MAVIGFTTKFPETFGRYSGPTYFPEKIMSAFFKTAAEVPKKYLDHPDLVPSMIGMVSPKIHTMRKPSKRRKPGDLLHMAINVRTSGQHQFLPEVKIASIQKVVVRWVNRGNAKHTVEIQVGDKILPEIRIVGGIVVNLAPETMDFMRNDGFDMASQFLSWFNETQEYDLIHWTPKTYEP